MSLIEMLEKDKVEAEQNVRQLEHMLTHARGIAAYIDDLLTRAKGETKSGDLSPAKEPVGVNIPDEGQTGRDGPENGLSEVATES